MNIELLLLCFAAHFVADFPLQNSYMATMKREIFRHPHGFWVLTAHAATHFFIIALISDSLIIASIVGITHWCIDFLRGSYWLAEKLHRKDKELFPIHLDQFLHLLIIALSLALYMN